MTFLRLGLKIISAKFGLEWTHFVVVVEKKSFFMNSKWQLHQFGFYHKLSCVTHGMSQDIKGKQINSYRPKHIFASCGHAQWSHDTKWFGHPQKGVPSQHTYFGVDFSRICWDMTQLPVWCLCCRFWLAVPVLKIKNPVEIFSEGCCDD